MILSMTTLINVARFVSTLQRKRNSVIFPCNLRKQMHAKTHPVKMRGTPFTN